MSGLELFIIEKDTYFPDLATSSPQLPIFLDNGIVVLKSNALESSSRKSLSNDNLSTSGDIVLALPGLLELLEELSVVWRRVFFTVWEKSKSRYHHSMGMV